MKYGYIILPAMMLLAACSGEAARYGSDEGTGGVPVVLRVEAIGGGFGARGGESRAPVDALSQTAVSLAYRTGPTSTYTKNINVLLRNAEDCTLHTGMQYPAGGGMFYVKGYHPVATPDAAGIVHYDISQGDLDLMVTQEVSGTKTAPIDLTDPDNKLMFKHKMTRITVRMKRAEDCESYPERIMAVIVTGNETGHSYLPTQARLDLSDGEVTFHGLGVVTAGYTSEGLEVPSHDATPAVIEAMVAPKTKLKINLLTTGNGLNKISLENTLLATLEENGGEEGTQYVINLSFRSASSPGGAVGSVDWEQVAMPDQPTGNNQWW